MKSDRECAVVFATLLAGAVGVGAYFASEQGAAFGLFSALTIGGGALCLFEKTVVRSAFALLVAFLGSAGLFLLLGSDFLAMTQVLIFAGGLLALILLGAMWTPPDHNERRLARIFGVLVFLLPLCLILAWRCAGVSAFSGEKLATEPSSDAGRIGVALVDPLQYAVVFEVAGLLLIVALVGGLYLARRRNENSPEVN